MIDFGSRKHEVQMWSLSGQGRKCRKRSCFREKEKKRKKSCQVQTEGIVNVAVFGVRERRIRKVTGFFYIGKKNKKCFQGTEKEE